MFKNPHLAHIVVETIVAGLVCVLFLHQSAPRRATARFETEPELIKKRFEAATMGACISAYCRWRGR